MDVGKTQPLCRCDQSTVVHLVAFALLWKHFSRNKLGRYVSSAMLAVTLEKRRSLIPGLRQLLPCSSQILAKALYCSRRPVSASFKHR
jgi:hypothetical protein